VLGQPVIRGDDIPQVFFAGHGLLALRTLFMAAQVESQTDAAQARYSASPVQVAFLTAAPAVHEQHPRHLGAGRKKGTRHMFIVNNDLDR